MEPAEGALAVLHLTWGILCGWSGHKSSHGEASGFHMCGKKRNCKHARVGLQQHGKLSDTK